jgi:hypothetical protein
MEVRTDNAAGRLYYLLKKAQEQNPETSLWQVWEKTLKASNNADLSRRIVYLKEPVQEVQDIVAESGIIKYPTQSFGRILISLKLRVVCCFLTFRCFFPCSNLNFL